MKPLQITAQEAEGTTDGLSYHFTRNNIDYTLLFWDDCVNVWKTNHQRGGTVSNDCFWDGVNNQGRKMSKVLRAAVALIQAPTAKPTYGGQSNDTRRH